MNRRRKIVRRCTCGYSGRNHSRDYCNPSCKKCNEQAADDAMEAERIRMYVNPPSEESRQ